MKKKLLIGLLASLMAFSFAAACGENDKPDNSGSSVNTESSDTGSDTGSEKSTYTVTLRNGNPMFDGSVQELEFEAGATLELPTLTAEGKTFKGWFAMDSETNEPTVAAPQTMPEEAIVLYVVWEITPYTLTIVNGETTTEVKFGVEYDFANGIELTVTDLAFFLADQLPVGTEDAAYKWAEEVPAEFALQNYTFTVNEVAPVTVTLVNGPLWIMESTSFVYLAEGAKLDLPFLTSEGKIFKGWFSFSYDEEGNEIATPAPETVPAEGIALTAVWEVVPYTISITLPNAEVVTLKIGVEDVYAEDPADEIVAYDNPYAIEFKIENALLAYATEEIAYVVELPTNAETGEIEFELKDYEFNATEAERVFTAYMPDYTTVEYKYGDAIELPTPDPIEGATFVKWVYYYEGEAFDVPETATSAIDQVAFKQVWEIEAFTLTLNNVELDPVWNEETEEWESVIGTKTITFGAMTDWEKGIEATPADLAWAIAGFLPENTAEYTYAWDKELPTNENGEVVFGLQNYEFTLVESKTEFTYTFVLNKMDRINGVKMVTLGWGEALTAPETATAGKEFLGWTDVEGNAVTIPETMPMEDITVFASYSITPYILTIVNGETTTETKFGVDYDLANGIEITVNDLPFFLADQLPKATDTTTYAWKENVPETFELKNYEFTVVATETISIADAVALGAGMSHNNYTSASYYVTGTVVNVANTEYGNLTIADEEGNTIYVYGTYSADGSIRYDAMENKPVVGDVVKYCSVVGIYNGTPQLKDARLVAHTKPETMADIYKAAGEAVLLKAVQNVVEAGDVTLATAGTVYTDVVISWASSNTNVAVVNGGTVTFTLPVEATEITLTATLTLGEASTTKTFTVKVAAAPAAGEAVVNVTFGEDIAANPDGQYVDETYKINDNLTISSHNNGCHFTTQLRLYDSSSNDGWVILTCKGAISNLTINMGYKKCNLLVYGSTDGSTWTQVGTITTTTTSYIDYSLDIDESLGYKYLKLDASGAQLRIKSLGVTMVF